MLQRLVFTYCRAGTIWQLDMRRRHAYWQLSRWYRLCVWLCKMQIDWVRKPFDLLLVTLLRCLVLCGRVPRCQLLQHALQISHQPSVEEDLRHSESSRQRHQIATLLGISFQVNLEKWQFTSFERQLGSRRIQIVCRVDGDATHG